MGEHSETDSKLTQEDFELAINTLVNANIWIADTETDDEVKTKALLLIVRKMYRVATLQGVQLGEMLPMLNTLGKQVEDSGQNVQ